MQPPSSATPLIGIYFSCIMILVAASVAVTIFIINFHYRLAVNSTMPHWVRVVFIQWLPWLLRISKPGAKITRQSILMQNKLRDLDKGDKLSTKKKKGPEYKFDKFVLAGILDRGDDGEAADGDIRYFGGGFGKF